MKYSKFFKLLEKKDHLINKLPNLSDEQKQQAIDFFAKHPNYESEIDWNRKDLEWEDFELVINKERISKSQLKNFVKEGTHYLTHYTSKNLIIYQPLTYMGSRLLASKNVAPGVEGKWCISYQKDKKYWNEYTFDKNKSFLILCTPTTKYALEISPSKSIVCWDAEDEKFPDKESFIDAISTEVPEISKILGKYVSKAVSEEIHNKILDYKEKDDRDVITFEENQKIAEELKQKSLIKSFPKNFKRQVAKQGYYEWEGDLNFTKLLDFGLISKDKTELDERIKYFKVKGNYNLSDLPIREIVWPMEIGGRFRASNCRNLTSVVIPNNINNFTFDGCLSLTKIIIPDSVTSIGQYAFNRCFRLNEITIPDSVAEIEQGAFNGCSSLTEIIIPDGVTSIKGYAFEGCSALTEITIPDSVTEIGGGAFYDCTSLTSVTIPDSVSSIGDYAFRDCSSLTSITIPNSITEIGVYVFYGCKALDTIYIDKEKDSLDLSKIKIPNTAKVYWKGEF